jgi:HSP20 family protein
MRDLIRWQPWSELVTLRQGMDRLFEDSFLRPGLAWRAIPREGVIQLPVDIYSTEDKVVIRAAVPGVDPDDVEITIEGDTLTIKGETKAPEDVDYICQEHCYGPFARTFTLNVPIQIDKATAEFENGVLTLTLPKAEEVKPKTIKVKAK